MNKSQAFEVEVVKTHARLPAAVKRITTPHGSFTTPSFMPVGTRAAVNLMNPSDLQQSQSQIILGGNTYHMLCAPGLDTLAGLGGMHPFMGWHGPMLTDSGGFQVFSLSKNSKICTINEEGARFKHPINGKVLKLNAESSIEAQKIIGADIIMAFDQCTPDDLPEPQARLIMERTHRWLERSVNSHIRQTNSHYGAPQALFGIIQGGRYQSLREQSAEFILNMPLDGIAIGGESIGFEMETTEKILAWLGPVLPKDKPIYTMGVGLQPSDLITVSSLGVDMFDCVAPTRNARHGALYCGQIKREGDWLRFETNEPGGRINISRARFAQDNAPIMASCDCYTCRNFTKAYLHYLIKSRANLYYQLASIHNVHVMQSVCLSIQACILDS